MRCFVELFLFKGILEKRQRIRKIHSSQNNFVAPCIIASNCHFSRPFCDIVYPGFSSSSTFILSNNFTLYRCHDSTFQSALPVHIFFHLSPFYLVEKPCASLTPSFSRPFICFPFSRAYPQNSSPYPHHKGL